MVTRIRYLSFFIFLLRLCDSCIDTRQAAYFANVNDTMISTKGRETETYIQKNDILSIHISSLNPEATAVFNQPNQMAMIATTGTLTTTNTSGYLVNPEGNIQLPILGNIKAAGLTKNQLKELIAGQIVEKKLLVDPIITIRHLNYEVTVIGEVGKPNIINVPGEKISFLKALGTAGDITVYGKKENVMLIREEDGKRTIARINLNSKNFLQSPYYYLQPNDIIYVEPNRQKIIAANRNQQLLPTVLSMLSIMAFVITQLVK